jgi:hypothetical protein
MTKIVLMLLLLVALIFIGPFVVIWALNTLFPVLNIPVEFNTWLAVAVLMALFRTSFTTTKD